MRKLPAFLTALALASTAVTAPAAVGQAGTYADNYAPRPWPFALDEISPTHPGGPVLADLPFDKTTYSIDYTWGEAPYPVQIVENDFMPESVDFILNNKAIYPSQFAIPFSAVITYADNSKDYVNGNAVIEPHFTLVDPNLAEPTIPAVPIPTATVTETVTETATITKTPAPVTLTETTVETTTEIPAPVTTTATTTKIPAPVTTTSTVTATKIITTTAAPVTTTVKTTETAAPVTKTVTAAPATTTVKATETVKVTETKTVQADTPPADDSSSTGGIIAGVLALLAAIGGGIYYWFTNLR